jgi:hypothetical protein
MFVRLRVQGFESSIKKVFQKEKLVNSDNKLQSSFKGVRSAGTNGGADLRISGPSYKWTFV